MSWWPSGLVQSSVRGLGLGTWVKCMTIESLGLKPSDISLIVHHQIHEMIDIVAIPSFDAWTLFIHGNRIKKTERLRTVFSKQNYMVYVVKIYTYTKRIFCRYYYWQVNLHLCIQRFPWEYPARVPVTVNKKNALILWKTLQYLLSEPIALT